MASRAKRGSALLTVLWATAALAAITLSLAHAVRSEAERAITSNDSLTAYYLATGAMDRALLWIDWGLGGALRPKTTVRWYEAPSPILHMEFPEGEAAVEVVPELSKLNVNTGSEEDLALLIAAAGAPEQAQDLAAAIIESRTPAPGTGTLAADYLSAGPSFRPPHSSFQEIEELLLVRGMTPELFYGGYRRDAEGRAVLYGGLRDCLSVYGSTGPFDVNTVRPELMLAIGLPPAAVETVLSRRSMGVIKTMEDLGPLAEHSPAMARLNVSNASSGTIWTLRATARPRLSDGSLSKVQRSVAALIKFFPPNSTPRWQIMRWYDDTPRLEPRPGARESAGQVKTIG